jgi:predicted enzyme related to lactoylglutathione lyase
MHYNRIVPLVTTDKLAAIKTFYTELFACRITFEGHGYLGLALPGDTGPELGFMEPGDCNEPTFAGHGMTFAVEVADVDAEYQRLVDAG